MNARSITVEDVLLVHNTLVQEFLESGDPISPPGVKSMALLESAVGRQHTGLGNTLKYPEVIDNAATLLYGLCNDHPFHNGNKRTALVSTLVHLDKNKQTLFGTSQHELYQLMLSVASHSIVPRRRSKGNRRNHKPTQDQEILAIASWMRQRAAKVTRGERHITFYEARKILLRFGYQLENPSGNMTEVVKYEDVRKGIIFQRTVTQRTRVGTIGWPGDNRDMGISDLKKLREMCNLTEKDGVDSECFYFQDAMIDTFVNRYRTLLRRLARV